MLPSLIDFLIKDIAKHDVKVLAVNIKNLNISNENELINCAQIVFDKAVNDPECSRKCAELCSELADVAVECEAPVNSKTFRDAIVQLSHEKFAVITQGKDPERLTAIVQFLGNLFNVRIVSDQLVGYWRIRFNESKPDLAQCLANTIDQPEFNKQQLAVTTQAASFKKS